MTRLVSACLLLGALLVCASAGRISSNDRLGDDPLSLKWLTERMRGAEKKKGEGEEGDCGIVATKYEVPPSMSKDFIEEWRRLQDMTMKEEGIRMYDLKKTMGDNVYFWTYGEWDSMDKFMEHFTADYMTDFQNFLNDRDIMWHMFPLKNVTDKAAMKKKESADNRGGKGKGDDPRDMMAHVVIEYHVPPSKIGDFIDAWKDCAMDTWDEEENSIYALRKVASMNHHFVAYGTWDSYDAYMDHFMAKHTRRLRKFLAESDIMWFSDPLMSLGEEEDL